MNWKDRLKMTLRARLIIITLILSLVGWFILGVQLFGGFFEAELLEIERLLELPAFAWSFRAVIVALTVVLVWKHKWLDRAWENPSFRYALFFVGGIGLIGWITGIVYLINI